MDYINTQTYRADLTALSRTSNELASANLGEQANRYGELNADIRQSLQLLAQDHPDVLSIDREQPGTIVDFEQLGTRIREFNDIISSLRMLYLEQESLDNFLRYTISSGSRELPVTSVDDPVLMALEQEVQQLEQGTVEASQRELAAIKDEISAQGTRLFSDDCTIKELCVQTGETIEECQALLDEIDEVQETRRASEARQRQDREDTVTKTYDVWQDVSKLQERSAALDSDIASVQATLSSLPPAQRKNAESAGRTRTEAMSALQQFLEKNLLPDFANVHDLSVDYALRRVHFTCGDNHVSLTLDESCALQTVHIPEDESLAMKVREAMLGQTNIYRVIHYIAMHV
ncbi:hypothetical protein DAKH74_047060 [Maudiozyma humilis]|uniref:Spindle pole body component KRE28 n=1 Tax=Maudiozyma humilis TaxID=51915 RepID=A0AAV5S2K6_MAUHU|nr:hypothetical protein DAKH74_047060 [Kazachstania humilis]